MEKWKTIALARRIMLIYVAALVLLGIVLYAVVGTQPVLRWGEERLSVTTEGEATVYTNRRLQFRVFPDRVEIRRPGMDTEVYTVVSVPEAAEEAAAADTLKLNTGLLQGVEVYREGTCLFRGGYQSVGGVLFSITSHGTRDVGPGDPERPDPQAVLYLIYAAEPTPRGDFGLLWLALLLCALTAADIFWAEELFRWSLRWTIRYAEAAEPTDWVLFTRWVGWIALLITSTLGMLAACTSF